MLDHLRKGIVNLILVSRKPTSCCTKMSRFLANLYKFDRQHLSLGIISFISDHKIFKVNLF